MRTRPVYKTFEEFVKLRIRDLYCW